jgi:hypothetical protein
MSRKPMVKLGSKEIQTMQYLKGLSGRDSIYSYFFTVQYFLEY